MIRRWLPFHSLFLDYSLKFGETLDECLIVCHRHDVPVLVQVLLDKSVPWTEDYPPRHSPRTTVPGDLPCLLPKENDCDLGLVLAMSTLM